MTAASYSRILGDAYFGHRSAQVAHLAVQSYVEKRRIDFDPDRELIAPA